MFLMNAWYVVASADEIMDKPLGRTVCGEAMVLFRAQNGAIAVLEDFCPHRGAPLSLGKVCNGNLVCGYHGLEMGCEGKTIAMPGQRVRGFPAIKRYAAIERYGFIWVWPGDAKLANADLLPEFDFFDTSRWAYGGGHYPIACDYRLMIDNLMDLTHENYVHASSIGQKEIDEHPCVTKIEQDHVTTSRFMHNVMPPPFWQQALRANNLADDVVVDRWQICHFTPPSHVMIEVGVAHAGHGGYDAPDHLKAQSVVVDFLTPETATTMHYFWGMARKFQVRSSLLTDSIREGQGKIFAEDMEILERQQRNLGAHPNRRLLMLNIDAGGVHARRIIETYLQKEKESMTA
jgi:vanillate monooxygenase